MNLFFFSDHREYLENAKRLKHVADNEEDLIMKAIKYHEAVLCFILTGRSMETSASNSAPTMYKDTLELMK